MPQLGETVSEGTISKWYKAAGDAVAAGDPLFEIETDKTSMEVPSLADGVLREIRAQAGETVPVGAIVAVVSETTATMRQPAVKTTATAAQPASLVPASPARRPTSASNGAQAPAGASAPAQRPIDPFHGVRTPGKN